MFEVTFLDAGLTFEWSRAKCEQYFGKAEFVEYAAGYLPHVVVVKVS